MGRKRTIDRAATMAAIEAVILREGVAGLSIDAVAREAGISKSSVVYDFRNKAGLLAAFTRKRMDAYRHEMENLRNAMDGPDRWLRAVIGQARQGLSDEDTSVAMKLAAAAHVSEECNNVMRQQLLSCLCDAIEDAGDERRSRLAFVALHGLKCLEYFGFHRFDDETRQQLLDDILALIGSTPATETEQN